MKLAACVVLYHPENSVLENIASYFGGSGFLIVVDNTEDQSSGYLTGEIERLCRKKLKIFRNQKNLGIAKALNLAAEYAISAGYKYLLTMDQDSFAGADMLSVMKSFVISNDCSNMGIISPLHKIRNIDSFRRSDPVSFVDEVMTSGNILNLEIYKKVGPFLEDLFIDSVDTEYCLRLKKNGYRVVRLNEAILYHPLGDSKNIAVPDFLKKTFYRHENIFYTNHSALRRYYVTRNKLVVASMYRDVVRGIGVRTVKYIIESFIKILLFERGKISKLGFMLRGFWDYKKRRLGKYEGRGR